MTAVATQRAQAVAQIAEQYYDSSEADEFYFNVWGGEDIHVGLYEDEAEPIARASHRTVDRILSKVRRLSPATRVLDIGAGYGGAARHLAREVGCRVTCLNLSQTQNARNRQLSDAQGLGDKIEVVHGNFEELPVEDGSFDVVWSQDAILHSGNRRKVLEEVRRVLRPGGQFIFTDPMQADDCPEGVLGPVLDRIHLDSLGSFAFYRAECRRIGLQEIECEDLSEQLVRHYSRVRKELRDRYDEMVRLSTQTYVDRMIQGLGHWIDAGSKGYLAWGILHFELPA